MALDERLRRDLEHAARPADPTGVYEHLIRRRERRLVVRRLRLGGLAIVVVAGTILGFYGLSRVFAPSGETPGVQPSPVPITAANGLIAYVRDSELHAMEPDGSADRVIATPAGYVRFAEWSPDGSRLAVITIGGDLGLHSLWVMNADGSGATKLATAMVVTSASWSPDGSTIAYVALPPDGRLAEIHVASVDGDHDRVVYDEPGGGLFPLDVVRFSPDGGTILFDEVVVDDQGRGVGMRILAMDAGGGDVRPFTSLELAQQPSWSPDGMRVALAKLEPVEGDDGSSASWNIFVVDADGSGPRRLTEGGTQNDSPHWSPDGTKIAYLNHASQRIVVVNPDGSNPVELPPTGVSALSWQPIPAGTPSTAPTPTGATGPGQVQDIGLGFPVCDVTSVAGEFAPGVTGTAYVATKMSDVGRCSGSGTDRAFQVLAVDVTGDGMADADFGPLECDPFCTAFAAPDVDGDGTDELLVQNIQFSIAGLRLYEVRAEPPEMLPVTVSSPGYPEGDLPPGAEPQFWIGGDGFQLNVLDCFETGENGPGLVFRQTSASQVPPDRADSVWRTTRTFFDLNPDGSVSIVDVGNFDVPNEERDDVLAQDGGLCGSPLPAPYGGA